MHSSIGKVAANSLFGIGQSAGAGGAGAGAAVVNAAASAGGAVVRHRQRCLGLAQR